MDDSSLRILMSVVCGCYLLLFIIVSYLCVVVRQIRQDFSDLSEDGNICFERTNSDHKYEEKSKRLNSREPSVSSLQKYEVYPPEPVSYRKRVKRQENSALSDAHALELAHCATNDEDARMQQIPNQSENSHPEKANSGDKSEGKGNRLSSILPRNRPRQQTALHLHPCELVSYHKRDELRNVQAAKECFTPNIEDVRIDRATKFIPLKFANDGFDDDDDDDDNDVQSYTRTSTWPAFPESLTLKRGRRKVEITKPVRERCCTMDISQI